MSKMGKKKPEIQRVNSYRDSRFSQKVLDQHGAFLAEGAPFEVEILSGNSARVSGARPELYIAVIEAFRFYAGHIYKFYNTQGELIREYPPVELFPVKLKDIQPSQFYVDEEKLVAIHTFIKNPEDIVIPVMRADGRYISGDGHTRLAAAVDMGFESVLAFAAPAGDYLAAFAKEARKRGIFSPYDLSIVSRQDYEVRWNQFCDEFIAKQKS